MDNTHNMQKDIQHIMASSSLHKKPSRKKHYLLYAICFLVLAILVFLGLPLFRGGKWPIQRVEPPDQDAPLEATNTVAPPKTAAPPEVIKNLTTPPPTKSLGEDPASSSLPAPPPAEIPTDVLKALTQPQ